MQYTVIFQNADVLGDTSTATQDDLDRYNTLVAEELAAVGLEQQYRVEATFDGDGTLPQDDALRAAVNRAFDRFCAGDIW